MIITITGKPCSGKGTVAKEFCKKYNFEYVCTGDMFREISKQMGYNSVLEFQQKYKDIQKIDNLIDSKTAEIGKTRSLDNIVIDSRLAWNFVPNSFKVFIDVQDEIAGARLLNANRENEKHNSLKDAIDSLKERWQVENDRYLALYGVNNLDKNKYDLVVDSSNLTPSEIVEIVYKNYLKFLSNTNSII